MSSPPLSDRLPEHLAAALRSTPRPDHYAGPMSPALTYGRHRGPAPGSARRAAVLALMVQRGGNWYVPLAVRPHTVSHHRGQIGLPGGQIEPGEQSQQTALREFAEELGVLPDCQMLGCLPSCYVFASNFEVVPWVAVSNNYPTWSPCAAEVERVIELPLTDLLDEPAVDEMTIVRGQFRFHAPCYRLDDDCIWGATAVVLCELAALIRGVGKSCGVRT